MARRTSSRSMVARLLLCGGMGTARLAELAYSRRNLRASMVQEGSASRTSYPFIVLVHSIAIVGTLLLGRRQSRFWTAVLLVVQPLRAWVLLTLGRRWNARGSVAPDLAIATNGPYAFIRHPNYSVVVVELLSLPMAFSLRRLALAVTAANAVLLALRIRDEERLLTEIPGYVEHFQDKPRFLPRLRFRTPGRRDPAV